tara:strand:+ start:848 stop:1231 length:384 start_codon:yes stop_codon:yes gene_type:complete
MNKRNKDNRFDIDLDFGNIGEEYIQDIFDGNCWVEVKTERDIWKKTGNMIIEYRCRGKLSGISTTKATTWIHCFYYKNKIEFSLIFNVDELKRKVKKLYEKGIAKKKFGGDDLASHILVIPIRHMIK